MCRSLGLPFDFPLETAQIGALPQWTSFGHIRLILDIERAFGIKIPALLIQRTVSYKNLVELLESLCVTTV